MFLFLGPNSEGSRSEWKALLTFTKDELIKKPYKFLGGSASNLAEAIEKLKSPSSIA
jgi:hypothetical protein